MTASYFHKLILAACCSALPFVSAQAAFEFIPAPSRAPAASGLPNGVPPASMAAQGQTEMTPAPAASVVSEALLDAQTRTSPQSLLPPAPAAPQYNLVPSTIARNTAAQPTINMNPLASAAPVPENGIGQLEQAMAAGAIMPASGGSAAPVSMAVMPSSSGRSSIGSMPLPPVTAPATPTLSAAAPAAVGQYAEAVGFGKELPLALAVSQIVPPDYAFSFSNSVNPGDLVSWEGGKAWNAVLNDTLGAVGASASIDEAKKEITIVSGAAAPAPASFGLMTPAAYTPPAVPAAPSAAMPTPRPPMVSANAPLYSPAPATTPEPAPMAAVPVAQAVSPAVALPAAMTASPAVTQPRMQLAGVSGSKVMDPKQKGLWEAPRGMTLRAILTEWSLKAGVELFWSSDFDYPVGSELHINGTFEEAVQTLLSGLRDAQPRPIGRLHPNLPDGPSVLVIETKHTIE